MKLMKKVGLVAAGVMIAAGSGTVGYVLGKKAGIAEKEAEIKEVEHATMESEIAKEDVVAQPEMEVDVEVEVNTSNNNEDEEIEQLEKELEEEDKEIEEELKNK